MLHVLPVAAAALGGLASAPSETPSADGGNPLFKGADPEAVVIDGRLWVYATGGGPTVFYAWTSPDLAHWERRGPILNFADVDWIDDDGADRHYAWAPGLARKDGRYFLYYSVGPQNPTPSRIGVAVADAPEGPFVDSGRPLLTGGHGFEAIDPMVFTDPATGTSYMYAGGSAGAKLRIFELGPDMTSLAREVDVRTPPSFTEGAFMHERDGVYYLSYSHGNYRDHTYSVHYATAPSPTGPWTYRGPILRSDERHKGPGHHSFFQDPATGDWFMAYHRWNDREGDGPYQGSRSVAIDRIVYDGEGLIQPVVMTDAGVGPRRLGGAAGEESHGGDSNP